MGPVGSEFTITIFIFLIILISGFWLSRKGKPYSPLVITLHKLIGLGAGVYLLLSMFRLFQANQLNPAGILAVFITFLLFLGLAATGGMLSTEKPFSDYVSTIHKILPYMSMVSTISLILIFF